MRGRIRRGTLETRTEREGNRERVLVRLPEPLPKPLPGALPEPFREPGRAGLLLAERDAQLARLEERLAAAAGSETELRRRVDELVADLQREREERRAEASDLRAERDRLLALVEALAAERRPERRPWPGLKAWWRRLIEGGEG